MPETPRIRARLSQGPFPGPASWIMAAFGVAATVGSTWGLPGSDSWSADSISPRSCGLGAIVETYLPGHFHTYPPLHMALLTLVSLPWLALAASRVGIATSALGAELIKPLYMTGIEAGARVIACAMGIGIVGFTIRLWTRIAGRRAGLWAGGIAAVNATLVYYAHTGNLEVPYLFWLAWAMVEMDRVMSGEERETRVLLLAVAAVLTKDQAAAALIVPLPLCLLVAVRSGRRSRAAWRRWALGGALATGSYALISGALTNPVGFRRRVAFLLGPASQTWAGYPRTFRGALSLSHDAFFATSHFASWAVCAAAAVGLLIALRSSEGTRRMRSVAPFAAAVSFALFFTLSARRSEDRFLLPESLFFFPYAAVLFDAASRRWLRARLAVAVAGVFALAPAALAVASIDATLLADPRYEAERFLQALAPGTHIEVYGGPIFLPRIPRDLIAVRPGVEPIADRQAIDGITDQIDPMMDPRARSPEAIVLATELSRVEVTEAPAGVRPFALMQYADATSHALFRGLLDGSMGYERALRAECAVPWPLECRRVHDSTAREVWIYQRRRPMQAPRL